MPTRYLPSDHNKTVKSDYAFHHNNSLVKFNYDNWSKSFLPTAGYKIIHCGPTAPSITCLSVLQLGCRLTKQWMVQQPGVPQRERRLLTQTPTKIGHYWQKICCKQLLFHHTMALFTLAESFSYTDGIICNKSLFRRKEHTALSG